MSSQSPTSLRTLSRNITVYNPLQTPYNPSHPRLIILFSWYAAAEPHIAKYTAGHQSLFPSSTILLIRCPQDSVFFPGSWKASLRPGVDFIREWTGEYGDDGNVLIQKFSNGGIGSYVEFCKMLREEAEARGNREGEGRMLRHTMIMDSCPGYFHWMRTHAALMASMPFWASPLIHAGMALNWVLHRPWGYDNPMDANAKTINERENREVQKRRLYVYGTGDRMVDWRDVEWHADEARFGRAEGAEGTRGKELEVRTENFEGGRHVANVRVDGERYWHVVRTAWEDA